QILTLSHEQPGAIAPAPPRPELADLLELLVVVAGDRHKKSASPFGAAPGWRCWWVGLSLSRPPAPRGRGRQSVGRCLHRGRQCPRGSCDRAPPRPAGARA